MTIISKKDFLDLSDAAYSFALLDKIGGLTLARNLVGVRTTNSGDTILNYTPFAGFQMTL